MAKLASLVILILAVAGALSRARSIPHPYVPSRQRSPAGPRSIEFIRTSCASTLYPTLCFASLSPYASEIGQDPLKLSEIATSLTLSRVRSLTSQMSSLSSSISTPTSTNFPAGQTDAAKALKDCTVLLKDAAGKARDSMAELRKLNAADVAKSKWCLSNVQTWMSAVLTNEETCTDGLKEAVGSKNSISTKVSGRVGVAKECTSIALALVNKLADN